MAINTLQNFAYTLFWILPSKWQQLISHWSRYLCFDLASSFAYWLVFDYLVYCVTHKSISLFCLDPFLGLPYRTMQSLRETSLAPGNCAIQADSEPWAQELCSASWQLALSWEITLSMRGNPNPLSPEIAQKPFFSKLAQCMSQRVAQSFPELCNLSRKCMEVFAEKSKK